MGIGRSEYSLFEGVAREGQRYRVGRKIVDEGNA